MLKTIETVITVLPDGSVRIAPLTGLTPGAHRAVLVVEEHASTSTMRPLPQLKMLDLSGWPADNTFRREELYDDSGR